MMITGYTIDVHHNKYVSLQSQKMILFEDFNSINRLPRLLNRFMKSTYFSKKKKKKKNKKKKTGNVICIQPG